MRRATLQFMGLKYAYKSGEEDPKTEEGFTIEDASIALACSAKDPRFAMFAKGFLGKLWEDTSAAPYVVLFNGALAGESLWRKVQILRRVESVLEGAKAGDQNLRREVVVHGNRFVLRQVFRVLSATGANEAEADVEGLTRDIVDRVAGGIADVVDDAHLAWTFKTLSKYVLLEKRLFSNVGMVRQPNTGNLAVDSGAEQQLKLFP